ncbi:hypothetical protein FHU14_001913 [Mesorhizobium sp. RMAD-H1]|nr:hypothetical protein [Mesorhizobium sp. RMAD-H1]
MKQTNRRALKDALLWLTYALIFVAIALAFNYLRSIFM